MDSGIKPAFEDKSHLSSDNKSSGQEKKKFKNFLTAVYKTFKNPGVSPVLAYEALRTDYGFLLESMENTGRNTRYSIVGTGLLLHIKADPDIRITGPFGNFFDFEGETFSTENLQSILKSIDYESPQIPGYSGGLAGYFSYDFALDLSKDKKIEGFKKDKEENYDFPLAEFLLPKELLVFDHIKDTITILHFQTKSDDIEKSLLLNPEENGIKKSDEKESDFCFEKDQNEITKTLDRVLKHLKKNNEKKSTFFSNEMEKNPECISSVSKEEFEELVRTAKDYIKNGDIFQVVLSKGSKCPCDTDPFLIYREMRRINPGPYMYYLDFSHMQIAGASPEMLIKVEGKRVESVPIAGTRRRGKTPKEDVLLEHELLSDKKECAEHLMLVDLSRNDIGRISKYGSVRVRDFMTVEKFSHVQHIVSTVEGELLEGKTSLDAFMSCFPAGTVSGAPKIRAIEIIEELEKTKRGLYAGAVGYIGLNGNIDFAITIRTVVVKNKTAYFQSGAGIVADSVPESEFLESENKAFCMMSAILSAGGIK